jgi:hypothetical protein
MALVIANINQKCNQLKLKICDNLNKLYKITIIGRIIFELIELFEQNFGTLFKLNHKKRIVEK